MAKGRKKKAQQLELLGLVLGIVHVVLEIVTAIVQLLSKD